MMNHRVKAPLPVDEPVRETGRELRSEIADAQTELCAVIDDALVRFQGRSLVSGQEVVDFLLDLRTTVAMEAQVALVPVAAAR